MLQIADQMLERVDTLHSRHLIHRDIKPVSQIAVNVCKDKLTIVNKNNRQILLLELVTKQQLSFVLILVFQNDIVTQKISNIFLIGMEDL